MDEQPIYKRVSDSGLISGIDHLMDCLHGEWAARNPQHVKNYANTAKLWLGELAIRMDEQLVIHTPLEDDPE